MALIDLQNVDKSYQLGEAQVDALKDVSLQIEEREFVALSGPSGSGKTTLCNLIGALDQSTAGSVRINNTALDSLTDDERSTLRNRSIGFIFQHFNLINVFDAVENVMLPLQLNKQRTDKAKAEAIELLIELGLEAQLSQRPDQMSGGQRQRVAIARALITRPRLVIADEPTANLDSKTAAHVIQRMLDYNQRWGTAFLLSTHNLELLEQVPRNIALCDGRVQADITSRSRP